MSIASWRDLALIYFIIAGFIAGLIPLAALIFMVMGLRLGRRRMMPYVHLAQYYAARIARTTRRGSERISRPFIVAAGAVERARHFATGLRKRFGIS